MPAQRIPVAAALVLAISALVGCRGGGSTHEATPLDNTGHAEHDRSRGTSAS